MSRMVAVVMLWRSRLSLAGWALPAGPAAKVLSRVVVMAVTASTMRRSWGWKVHSTTSPHTHELVPEAKTPAPLGAL